ncbi:transcriptional regulator, HxlR family [Hydrogenobacter thermophilus TK-6]|uniref:Transcriptional regulator n=1 Tax=Hydrogenobacter thermophilus (strain DSM 6534 / IAM 12695 / TK-6) TaxID=608538 RepID=D3DI70_HYDTT|nr:helix-turn-helix domain-containing protein [Hydrogenobacter thermophilus]ADO45451.1 transcriptional regulator, HxlR family [Hydrogenobacter thermophilus TK-6]BAI69522.1 transcriptional regulator [Hydrogenobacter thermophilus TK-6]
MSKCPIEVTLSVIGGKWKFLIIKELMDGPKRFSQLMRSIKGITQRMLTKQLRELERDGIIERILYPQIPPKVEYTLTPVGRELRTVLLSLHRWGSLYMEKNTKKVNPSCETRLLYNGDEEVRNEDTAIGGGDTKKLV